MYFYEDLVLNKPNYSPSYTVSKQEIIDFASEWDPQPFHTDEEAASMWPLGLTASGVHTIAISVKLSNQIQQEPSAAVAGLGWNQVKMPNPVKPGDTLQVKAWICDKRESNSRPDCGIITNQLEVYNQREELVLSYQIVTLVLKKPAD